MQKDEFFLKRIRELANLSYQRDIVTFSDFLNLNEQNIVHNHKNQMPGVITESFGGYGQAERQMIAFHPGALSFTWEYPITCLKIEPRAIKFSEALTHRDYLGAILNLGIDRSVIGDILIQDRSCMGILSGQNSRLSHGEYYQDPSYNGSAVSKADNPQELSQNQALQPVTGTCASVRLDALDCPCLSGIPEAAWYLISRADRYLSTVKLITSNGYEPKEGDIISVRGKGRLPF